MKKVFFIIALALVTAAATYAQVCWAETAFNREKNLLLEVARSGTLPNGCGPAGTPQILVSILNSLSDGGACDQHDRDYSTLGVSKREADEKFRLALLIARVPSYLVDFFYTAVVEGGQSAYDSAQATARRVQQLEADPSSRLYSIPSDNPRRSSSRRDL